MSKIDSLKDRSLMLQKARSFFYSLGLDEVDCPALASSAPVDVYIDVMEVDLSSQGIGYLHTSPEYCMKRLLSMGMGDIFYLGHVFRQEESGSRHNPEFMMAEWYRLGIPFEKMIEEVVDFIRLFIGPVPYQMLSYRDALKQYAHIDYVYTSTADLKAIAANHGILPVSTEDLDKDTLLQLILGFCVEPHFPKECLTVLHNYPATQAALAKTYFKEEEEVANRFEIYYQNLELANGFEELTDAVVQRQRFEEANLKRAQLGKKTLKIDEHFLLALAKGLPPCCGVAVGFDRLMMVRQKASNIRDVMPFSWEEV